MAVHAQVGLGGRDGGQPVTGGAQGDGRAAARRVPQAQRRSCQIARGESPCGPLRPYWSLDLLGRATLARDDVPDGAQYALRALEAVERVVTDQA